MFLIRRFIFTFVTLFIIALTALAQTSWKGTSSTAWNNAANWTAGVPNATLDAIIGDASFTGAFQPSTTAGAACRSLTLGGVKAATLTINKNLTVSGNVTINTNGAMAHGKTTLKLTGNWVNNGTYTGNHNNTAVVFGGIAQTIGGSANTAFRRLTINAGSTTTLARDVAVNNQFTVSGTFIPGNATTYTVTGNATLAVTNGGVLRVLAPMFAGNYNTRGAITLNTGSIVDYAATAVNQTVSNALTYATLRISGGGIKTLEGNLPALRSGVSTDGNIYVVAGILDLGASTINRGATTSGGTLSVANGATLRIGGTNTFPANYATNTLSLTSTVEYAGTAQTVAARAYGNLTLSSSGGAVIKTMPITDFTVGGNLTSSQGAGTAVTYTAASNITVSGNVVIGVATTFNGGSFTHNIAGNWTSNGTFTGSTSTVRFTATGAVIGGSGVHNFYNLESGGSNVTAAAGTTITVSGDFSTTGSGTFTHTPTGTLTLSGTGKTISGTGIQFDNLAVSGTITTAASFGITGNLAVSNAFTSTAGTVTMSGASKTISGGTLSLNALSVSGSVSTASNFTITSLLSVNGSLTATNGTATFSGATVLSGTANLYNVAVTGTSLQLAANAVLGIANTYTPGTATLNVTAAVPNTVNFNGTGVQSINAGTYHHLAVSNGNTKTAGGAITTNGDFTIASATTFNGGSATHSIHRHWVNNGTFVPATSTVQFVGMGDAQLSGATTFNILTVNKTAATNGLTLLSNVSTPVVNMTNGWMKTGANVLTITNTRNGNGIILGTIQRTHSFTTGISYAFESPDNSVHFSIVSGVTSVTVTVAQEGISDFPFGGSVNRVYTIAVPTGTYNATLRLHYEDAELNGNNESTMNLWRYNGSAWGVSTKTGNNITSNYVEQSGLTNITNRWTLSDNSNVVSWNGSVSSDWHTAANWTTVQGTPGKPPTAADIVQLGTGTFTNQPIISTAVTVKNIVFGSVQPTTLTLNTGGTLTTNGSITGTWSSNASHTINVGAQALNVGGDLLLSDGTAGRAINLNMGAGSTTIAGSLLQSGGSNISFSGAGTLTIGNNYTYTNGSFAAGTGTVVYNGTAAQAVAGVPYHHLTINKSTGVASINTAATLAGNLTINSGQLELNAPTTINGNVSVLAGATLNGGAVTTNVGGNWSNTGTFVPATGTVNFNGTGTQTISASSFNHLSINKPASTAVLAGNTSINGSLVITAGILNLATYAANRTSVGGSFTLADGAALWVGGTTNFPANFATYTLGTTSTVHYNGSGSQTVAGVTYGHLMFSNGAATPKTLSAAATIYGDLTINSGASFNAAASNINLHGHWTNSGSFVPATSTLLLHGTNKTITGNTTFYRLNIYGSYTVVGSDITFNNRLFITSSGSYAAGSGTATVHGDLTNSGSLTSNGTTTFTGTVVQNIRLLNAIASNSSGVINFNGAISPLLNSTTTPIFANLNINNTAGVNPSVNWSVLGNLTVGAGASFDGGASTHTFGGNVTNNGTIRSSGTLHFNPLAAAATAKLTGTTFSSTGTVIFGGTAPLSVTGTPTTLTDVIIANTNAVSPAAGWNILGNFNINGNAVFNAGSHSYTVGGNIESTGILNGGTSTFAMTAAAGELSGSAGTTFHHFTIAPGAGVTTNSDINVAGNFTNNGSFDGSIGTLIMTGNIPATIGGTTNPSTIAQLAIVKAPGSTVALAGNIAAVTDLYIASGTLDAGSFTISQDAAGGLLTIDDGAILKIGGTNTMPIFSTPPTATPAYALSRYSTVEYAGSTQTIAAVPNYGNLTISTAGTKTPAAALNVLNHFSLNNGTFNGGSHTHSVGGNWIMTSGAFNNTGTTILLNGTDAQDISSTGAFRNLTINKASGLTTLSSPVSVVGTLALTSGKINIGNHNLALESTGTITGASAVNYIIAEGAGSLVQPVERGTSKTFPVGLTIHYLPASLALTAGSVTDNFSVRLLPAAYTGGTTGSAVTSNAVNATWVVTEAVPTGSTATLTLQWPTAVELPGFNRFLTRLASYSGSSWDYGTNDLSASGTNPYTISRSGITSFNAFAISSFNALPVTWLRVSGKNENSNNHIYWSTATETNNSHFVIEASVDGRVYNAVGTVKGASNSAVVQEYSFIHKNVAPETFYRIKQVDIDGKFSYSKVIKITSSQLAQSEIRLLTNPVKEQAVVMLQSNQKMQSTWVVTDAAGKVVYRKEFVINAGTANYYLDASQWSGGIYLLFVQKENGEQLTLRFVKK